MNQIALQIPAVDFKGAFNLAKIEPTEDNSHKKQYKLGNERNFKLGIFLQAWKANGNPLLPDPDMAELLTWTVDLPFEIRAANMMQARKTSGVGEPDYHVKRAASAKKATASGGLTAIEVAVLRAQVHAAISEVSTTAFIVNEKLQALLAALPTAD